MSQLPVYTEQSLQSQLMKYVELLWPATNVQRYSYNDNKLFTIKFLIVIIFVTSPFKIYN